MIGGLATQAALERSHLIVWDGVGKGEVIDGGGDMYGYPPFGGNRISTSLCPHGRRLAPYTDGSGAQLLTITLPTRRASHPIEISIRD